MDAGNAAVIAALVTLIGGILVALIQKGSNISRREHATNTSMIRVLFDEVRGFRHEVKTDISDVRTEMKDVGEKLSNHVTIDHK